MLYSIYFKSIGFWTLDQRFGEIEKFRRKIEDNNTADAFRKILENIFEKREPKVLSEKHWFK
jgi:hypothetical protein